MSQPHRFSGSQLDNIKFSIFNNFHVYSPICMKFAPNGVVLEIISFWVWFYVSDPFPLKKKKKKKNWFPVLMQ